MGWESTFGGSSAWNCSKMILPALWDRNLGVTAVSPAELCNYGGISSCMLVFSGWALLVHELSTRSPTVRMDGSITSARSNVWSSAWRTAKISCARFKLCTFHRRKKGKTWQRQLCICSWFFLFFPCKSQSLAEMKTMMVWHGDAYPGGHASMMCSVMYASPMPLVWLNYQWHLSRWGLKAVCFRLGSEKWDL